VRTFAPKSGGNSSDFFMGLDSSN